MELINVPLTLTLLENSIEAPMCSFISLLLIKKLTAWVKIFKVGSRQFLFQTIYESSYYHACVCICMYTYSIICSFVRILTVIQELSTSIFFHCVCRLDIVNCKP